MVLCFNFAEAKEDLARYEAEPLEIKVSQKTQRARARVWAKWEEFAKGMNFDPETIWVDLLLGKRVAESHCQTFLKAYVKGSKRRVRVLGEEETTEVNTIKSGITVEDIWQALVTAADIRVMAPKRREDPRDAGFWSLNFDSRAKGSNNKPTYLIARWLPELAHELNLNLGQSFVKREATAEDVILLLTTLWERAVDITSSPEKRIAFHTTLVLGALGGWRPQSLMQIDYEDVEIGWLRDGSSNRFLPTAKIMIYHVKLQDVIRRDQKDRVGFWITKVPHKIICLLTLLLSRAIADNAFKNGYTHVSQVLERRLKTHVDYVPAKWKEGMLKKKIVPITYNLYKLLWDRTVAVAGRQNKIRPYSMRVGAGGRLNGSLAPALRNFILSNSTEVFETSYIPVNISSRLQEIAFPKMVDDTQKLIEKTSQAFLHRDGRAPVHITRQDLDDFETRADVQALRDAHQTLKIDPSKKDEAKKCLSRIKAIKDSLESQLLKQRRDEYFEAANGLHEKDESAAHLQDLDATDPHKRNHALSDRAALRVGQHLVSQDSHQEFGRTLVDYLHKRLEPLTMRQQSPQERSICFLPKCRRDFSSRSNLSDHVRKYHGSDFEQQFFCPECQILEAKNVTIGASKQAWSSHVARHHGAIHAPAVSEKCAYCWLCNGYFTEGGLRSHLTLKHVKSGQFQQPFPCPACLKENEETVIDDVDSWQSHVAEVHSSKQPEHEGAMGIEPPQGRKRKREERQNPSRKKKACATSGNGEMEREFTWESGAGGDWSPRNLSPELHADEEFWVTGRDDDCWEDGL
ncbi:hypothetical protein B0T10DRAFT_548470 [Thelonectria olida]|uniref:C2H2-type domain-containing protein n=1 Tax=Thelonectria olida TaxID=1576542 RepID=A0A9P8W7D2_9HYPO|nr:hypothetical protein B0T10DRAFT_548470 [Thelonectria olida]